MSESVRSCGIYAGTESEFDYSKTSGKGPAFWGTLKTEWATCGTGKLQSPVDLTVNGGVDVVPQLETVTRRYKPCANTMLTNKGTSIEVLLIKLALSHFIHVNLFTGCSEKNEPSACNNCLRLLQPQTFIYCTFLASTISFSVFILSGSITDAA